MLHAVGSYMNYGFMFLEKGLAHPSFLGRAVSWGIFYGALAIVAKKVSTYAYPKIRDFWKSWNECKCQKETPKGETVLTDRKEPEKPKEKVKEKTNDTPSANTLSNDAGEEDDPPGTQKKRTHNSIEDEPWNIIGENDIDNQK